MKYITLVLFLVSSVALASPTQTITGPQADKLFLQLDLQGAELMENTVCITTLELGNVSCTMIGSHESCGREQETVCTIH